MTLKQIEVFLRLSNNLSFAKTAEQLYTTQPTVTREIQTMEYELGIQLFRRTKRIVELTPAGNMLKDELQPLYSGMQNAIEKVRDCQNRFNTRIRIGYCHSASVIKLPEGIRSFRKQYPDVQFQIIVKNLGQLSALYESGQLDILFGMKNALQEKENDGYDLLYRGHLGAVIPVGHDLFDAERLTLKELNGYPLAFQEQSEIPGIMAKVFRQLGRICRDSFLMYCHSTEEVQMLLLSGLAATVAPQYSFMPHSDYRHIPLVIEEKIDLDMLDYYVLWKKEYGKPEIKEFVGKIRELYASEAQD